MPILLGFLAAFGASWYSNKKNAERLRHEADDQAAGAIRSLARALRDTADHLEARSMAYGDWDPTRDLINQGGQAAIRDAYNAASPYFHRLDVRSADKNPLRNEFPDYGDFPMDGAASCYERAAQIQTILDRGLHWVPSNSVRSRRGGARRRRRAERPR